MHAFFAEHDCRFVFTRIEKAHHSSLKFVDTIIDSGINEAVPGHVYALRPMRLGLAHAIVSNVSPRNQRDWWAIFQSGDIDGFQQIVRRVLINVRQKERDRRMRELATGALEWALNHPDGFPELQRRRDEHDSPNFVALTLVLAGIHSIAGNHAVIERFVHDEQNQFAKYMKAAYQHANWNLSMEPLAWMTDMAERDTFHCKIEFHSRKNVSPLRLTDVALWLVRRQVERDDLPRECMKLTEWISDRAHYNEVSRAQLEHSLIQSLSAVAELSVTPEQEARGREILARLEEKRKRSLGEM
jgi:hypothetical protein